MISVGSVVKSKAGHDSNRFFAVIKLDGDFAFLCDGKLRTLDKPKRKRLKHLQKTNTVLCQLSLGTDKQIRNALHRFNYGENQNITDIFQEAEY
ncbi:MAG: KOW domain-containing RNA-binding protein [Oscillospiraceae bacterium]